MRTVRFYRERKLIPPPRREGRIAWYDDHHLARLRTIAALLERGHTLNGIAELADAFDHGRDVGDLLGLGEPTEETPVRLTPEELAARFEGEVTPENLAAAMELGYLGTDGDELVHISHRLLEVSSALVREGIPLGEVLQAGCPRPRARRRPRGTLRRPDTAPRPRTGTAPPAPAGPQRGGGGAVPGAGPADAQADGLSGRGGTLSGRRPP